MQGDDYTLTDVLQMPRHIFSAAVAWAMKADKSTFWKGYRRGNKGDIQSPKDSIAAVKKSPGVIQRKSEEWVFLQDTSLYPILLTDL